MADAASQPHLQVGHELGLPGRRAGPAQQRQRHARRRRLGPASLQLLLPLGHLARQARQPLGRRRVLPVHTVVQVGRLALQLGAQLLCARLVARLSVQVRQQLAGVDLRGGGAGRGG
jgi:hypothetical protein